MDSSVSIGYATPRSKQLRHHTAGSLGPWPPAARTWSGGERTVGASGTQDPQTRRSRGVESRLGAASLHLFAVFKPKAAAKRAIRVRLMAVHTLGSTSDGAATSSTQRRGDRGRDRYADGT